MTSKSPWIGASLAIALAICSAASIAAQPAGPRLALVGGTVYPGPSDQPIRDGVVLIENGRIAQVAARSSVRIPAGVETIDCTGLTVMAGFWNSHVHFLQRKWANAASLPAADLAGQLQAMLTRYGFTSVFDTWSPLENTKQLRQRIEAGEVAGPRVRLTGEGMFGSGTPVPEAMWSAFGFIPMSQMKMTTIATAADAESASRTLLAAGADGLKFYAATPGVGGRIVPEAAMKAGIDEAHRREKPVFVHPTTSTGLLAGVRAGADVLTHTTPQTGPWDAPTIAAMKDARVALIPTLKLWQYELRHEPLAIETRFVQAAVGQLRAWNSAGGTVLFGTDVGYMSEYDTSEEYRLMAAAGMSFQQILVSLTTAPAERFGDAQRLGRIAPGFLADLTVVGGDPAADISALARARYTIRDGRIIYRASDDSR